MVDIQYYTKLFFNEETGKERYGLISKKATEIFIENSEIYCRDFAMECYKCELYYIQAFGVYILGLVGSRKTLHFLKNTENRLRIKICGE